MGKLAQNDTFFLFRYKKMEKRRSLCRVCNEPTLPFMKLRLAIFGHFKLQS